MPKFDASLIRICRLVEQTELPVDSAGRLRFAQSGAFCSINPPPGNF